MDNTIKWLLEKNMPAVRYRCLTDLLDESENNPEVIQARREITNDPQVGLVKKWVHGDVFKKKIKKGFVGSFSSFIFYAVIFFAEIGVPELAEIIRPTIEETFLSSTATDGSFEDRYGRKLMPCQNGYLIYSLGRLGYKEDDRIKKSLVYLCKRVRSDGGWLCIKQDDPSMTSCPNATSDILRAFTLFPELKESKIAKDAVDFLLRHWHTRVPIPDWDFPEHGYAIGERFFKLRFPLLHNYYLLTYAFVLSEYPKALKAPEMKEIGEKILKKRDAKGRFRAESVYKELEDFEFGRRNQPSKWITLKAMTILKRIYGTLDF